MKRPVFGDVFELKTRLGYVYIQYVNRHNDPPRYGDLVRILDGIFTERPGASELRALVEKKENYYAFIVSVNYSLTHKQIEYIGHEDVPKQFHKIPEFRMSWLPNPVTGKVDFWRVWKNGKEYKLGKMNKKYINVPTLGISNVYSIIQRAEYGYKPSNDWDITGKIDPELREKLRWPTDNKDDSK